MEHIPVAEGAHHVRVEIGNAADKAEHNHVAERDVPVPRGRRVVVLYDKLTGFSWHP